MMHKGGWVWWALIAVACGGRSRTDGNANGNAGTSAGSGNRDSAGAGNGGASNSSAGSAGSCPDSNPGEGAPCPTPGASCSGFGTLSCPLTAVCSADSKWQINCPSTMFGPCSCPHHDFGRVPDEHRATAAACSHTRAASLSAPGGSCAVSNGGATCPPGQCSQDSACTDSTEGANGRCVQSSPRPFYVCSYDTCFADSDCGAGSVCQCREPADGVAANYCTQRSTCRVDADCGTNGYCSPSMAHEWCAPIYACHTPEDECLNDSDCGADTHCDFDVNAQHWTCGDGCGPIPP